MERLDEVIIREEQEIRARGVYSPTLAQRGLEAPLSFRDEYPSYKERILSLHPPEYQTIISKILLEIDCNQATSLVSCIPTHIEESVDTQALCAHVRRISRSGGLVFFFLNGIRDEGAEAKLASIRQTIKDALAEAGLQKSTFTPSHLFEKRVPIGTLRGLLCDAVATSLFDAGAVDPIFVSNDFDFVSATESYAHLIRSSFEDPRVDFISGPIYFGYDPWGNAYGNDLFDAPELMLSNRLLDARRRSTRAANISRQPYFTTEGPNSAFRFASLLAAGGYNYKLEIAEDDQLGTAVFGMRRPLAGSPYPLPQHTRWLEDLWLASNPRRVLKAISQAVPLHRAWFYEPFEEVGGYSIDNAEILRWYHSNSDLIQLPDICETPGKVSAKVQQRIFDLFSHACTNFSMSAVERNFFAERYGITLKHWEDEDLNFSDATVEAPIIAAFGRMCGLAT